MTDNEKRLGLVLGSVVFLAANAFGYILYSDYMKRLAGQEVALKQQRAELEAAKLEADLADQRREFIDTHLLPARSVDDQEEYLASFVAKLADQVGDIELSKQLAPPTLTTLHCLKSRYRFSARGPWSNVKNFIHGLMEPTQFRFVSNLTIVPKKSEEDDSVQLAEVAVAMEKWWPLDEGAENNAAAPAENEQPPADAVSPDTTAAPAPPAPAAETAATPAPAPADSPAPVSETPTPAVVTPPPAPAVAPESPN